MSLGEVATLQPSLDTQSEETTLKIEPTKGPAFWDLMLNPQKSGQLLVRRAVKGQSMVELALSLPFLITLLLALLEIGFLIRSHLTVLYATREGARSEAAAGDIAPTQWSIVDNSARFYQQSDGDTVMVNNVNSALQDEKPNALFLSTYKADNAAGDPCLHQGSWAQTTTDPRYYTGCAPISTTTTTDYTKWPVYHNIVAGKDLYYQEVFQRLGASNNYGFSRQMMDHQASGYTSVQDCPTQAPYMGSCGSNINNIPGNWDNSNPSQGTTANPWYPGYRCEADPIKPSLSALDAASNSVNYYNMEPNAGQQADANGYTFPVTRDWVGVRIDYQHKWITPWFPGSPLVLSSRSVYNLEPRPFETGNVTICSNSPTK